MSLSVACHIQMPRVSFKVRLRQKQKDFVRLAVPTVVQHGFLKLKLTVLILTAMRPLHGFYDDALMELGSHYTMEPNIICFMY